MYSVFIVDDETIVREGLRSKIDWEHSQFSFAGEAGDGEIALSMIQDIKPDILITDIKMPFMDGLELAQTVKKLQPWIAALSDPDNFELTAVVSEVTMADLKSLLSGIVNVLITLLKAIFGLKISETFGSTLLNTVLGIVAIVEELTALF